jgi:hypothetical protein
MNLYELDFIVVDLEVFHSGFSLLDQIYSLFANYI